MLLAGHATAGRSGVVSTYSSQVEKALLLNVNMFKIIKSVFNSAKREITDDPEVKKSVSRNPRIFDFIKSRLDPEVEFGLTLTIGVLITLFFVYLFFGVVQDLIGHEPLVQSDLLLINLIKDFRTPSLNNVMFFFTCLAQWQVVFFGVALVCVLFAVSRKWHQIVALVISVAGGQFFVWIIKNALDRPRPPLLDALVQERSYSFPSGHAFIAFSFYGLIAYFVFKTVKSKLMKAATVVFLLVLILAIGLSRLYLGAHWPSDVLASYAAGAAWLAALITALEIQDRLDSGTQQKPFLKKSSLVSLGLALFIVWASYLGYFFYAHPLPHKVVGAKQAAISKQ